MKRASRVPRLAGPSRNYRADRSAEADLVPDLGRTLAQTALEQPDLVHEGWLKRWCPYPQRLASLLSRDRGASGFVRSMCSGFDADRLPSA